MQLAISRDLPSLATQRSATQQPTLLTLPVALFSLIVAFHLGGALLGKSLYHPGNLGTALEYARGPINLFRPLIVGFNATGTPTAWELPLWQAAAGLMFKLAGSTWYGLANLVELAFFATCLWPFFQLARQYVGERAAWWALVFFLTQPLTVLMAGAADTYGVSLVVSFWFLFFVDKMVRSGYASWCIPAAAFAVIGGLLRLPLSLTAALCSIALLLVNRVRNWQPWALLTGVLMLAASARVVWWHHTNALAGQAVYPYAEMRAWQTHHLVSRYFGSIPFLLRPGNWLSGGWRWLHSTLGTLPVIGLLAVALLQPQSRLAKAWLGAALLVCLIFTHQVIEHWQNYLVCCPPVALLCGSTLARWETHWAREIPAARLYPVVVGDILVLSTADGLNALKIGAEYDSFPQAMSRVVSEHTKPSDRLVVHQCDTIWGGEVLYRADRQGLTVAHLTNSPAAWLPTSLYHLLNNEADLGRLKALGYNKLVLISQSPIQYAADAIASPSQLRRALYPASISKTVDAWPVVFQSEDILIKEIP